MAHPKPAPRMHPTVPPRACVAVFGTLSQSISYLLGFDNMTVDMLLLVGHLGLWGVIQLSFGSWLSCSHTGAATPSDAAETEML